MKWLTMLTLLMVGACSSGTPRDGAPPATPPAEDVVPLPGVAPDDDPDMARIASLEAEARALANPAGCASGDACRTAPVGNRPCGGPREYVVYCPATTDSAALFRALEELVRAEDAYNRKHELASTCEFRMPPETALRDGMCVAAHEGATEN
jgi:hypothetical protein